MIELSVALMLSAAEAGYCCPFKIVLYRSSRAMQDADRAQRHHSMSFSLPLPHTPNISPIIPSIIAHPGSSEPLHCLTH